MELEYLLGDLAIGSISGYSIGIFSRKFFRLVSIIIGGYLASLLYLSGRGFITVNWAEINSSAEGVLTGIGNLSLGASVLGTGAIAGFIIGWRAG